MSRDHRLRNTTTRPVELHLTAGVTIVPALGEARCAAEDLDLGQLRVLRARGVLTALPTGADANEEPVQAAVVTEDRAEPQTPAAPDDGAEKRTPSRPRKRRSPHHDKDGGEASS
jgi:hypothetical protein